MQILVSALAIGCKEVELWFLSLFFLDLYDLTPLAGRNVASQVIPRK